MSYLGLPKKWSSVLNLLELPDLEPVDLDSMAVPDFPDLEADGVTLDGLDLVPVFEVSWRER